MEIDFVLLWVDGKEPEWLNQFAEYSQERGDKSVSRFRDWENLKYWFRSVEKFTPWVNKIHFITCGHYPEWLNLKHPKLNFVKHSEYIPEEFLPTFNSRVIELNLHRLESLSENFVLFNDDCFVLQPLPIEHFFYKDFPCDLAVSNAISGGGISRAILNNIEVINNHFDKKEVIRKYFKKWFNLTYGTKMLRTFCLLGWPKFTGFYDSHLPQPFLKSVFKEVWDKEFDALYETCTHKFKDSDDLTQYLMRYWQLVSGRFYPKNVAKNTLIIGIENNNLNTIETIIRYQLMEILVINDSESANFELSKDKIVSSFDYILPNKSKYEL